MNRYGSRRHKRRGRIEFQEKAFMMAFFPFSLRVAALAKPALPPSISIVSGFYSTLFSFPSGIDDLSIGH